MDFKSAEIIAKKARALKHCDKLLSEVDKKGEVLVTLNCTGVQFLVKRGDGMHLRIMTTKSQLVEEIAAYELIKAEETTIKSLVKQAIQAKEAEPEKPVMSQSERMKAVWAARTPEQRKEIGAKVHAGHMRKKIISGETV